MSYFLPCFHSIPFPSHGLSEPYVDFGETHHRRRRRGKNRKWSASDAGGEKLHLLEEKYESRRRKTQKCTFHFFFPFPTEHMSGQFVWENEARHSADKKDVKLHFVSGGDVVTDDSAESRKIEVTSASCFYVRAVLFFFFFLGRKKICGK